MASGMEMEKGNGWWRVRVAGRCGEVLGGGGFKFSVAMVSIRAQWCGSEHDMALRVIKSEGFYEE